MNQSVHSYSKISLLWLVQIEHMVLKQSDLPAWIGFMDFFHMENNSSIQIKNP